MNTWPDETKEEDAFESCRTCSRKIAPYEKYCAWHAADEDEDETIEAVNADKSNHSSKGEK